MQRRQILDRQLYCIACTVAPIVARQAALKMPTAIVDHDERLLALVAGAGHCVTLTSHEPDAKWTLTSAFASPTERSPLWPVHRGQLVPVRSV